MRKNNNNILAPINKSGFGVTERGDRATARITDNDRKVVTIHKNNGDKYSATQYPNGTVVETRTTKRK